jgi:hypothetical protein
MKTQNIILLLSLMISFSVQLTELSAEKENLVGLASPLAPTTKPLALNVSTKPLLFYKQDYFLGQWNAIGYKCDEHTSHSQLIRVRYANGRLYGIKLTGDNCVPAKKLSFEAELPTELFRNVVLKAKLVVGSPKCQAARQVDEKLTIIDLNTFSVGGRTFYRLIDGNANAHGKNPNEVTINMRPYIHHNKNYLGPKTIRLNPRNGMRSPVRRFVIVEESVSKPATC